MISSGITQLDKISGGFKPGDNVVWQVRDAAPVEYFMKAYFIEPHDFNSRVIYINFNYSPHTVCKKYPEIFSMKNVVLIDAFTNGKGRRDEVFLNFYKDNLYPHVEKILVENPDDPESFAAVLSPVQAGNRSGSFYLFDSLTGMKELWKDEKAVLDFFAFTCPKLYDLDTIAYWVLESEAHSREFIAGISHITQVVFDLDEAKNGEFRIKVNKLDRRESSREGGADHFRIIGDAVAFIDKKPEPSRVIGETLRELRRGLNITQAELADKLKLTSGALSQIENGVITPSLSTLISIADFFNRPVEFFLTGTGHDSGPGGYELLREGTPLPVKTKGVFLWRIYGGGTGEPALYSVKIEPMVVVESPLIFHKGLELIYLIKGNVTFRVSGEMIELTAGQSMYISTAFIESATPVGDEGGEYLHFLL